MTTLFDSSTIVKPGTSGRGLLRSLPHDVVPFTAADYDVEPDWDTMAAEAASLDRCVAGHLL
jgi:hypothetical protein